jgi:hypothetical protein
MRAQAYTMLGNSVMAAQDQHMAQVLDLPEECLWTNLLFAVRLTMEKFVQPRHLLLISPK